MKSLTRASLLVATILLLSSITLTASAQKHNITGRVVDQNTQPIPFATVVLVSGIDQVAGGVTNDEGTFTLYAPTGTYTMHVAYVGYKSLEREITIDSTTDMGDITIEQDNIDIDEVVVTAQLLRR